VQLRIKQWTESHRRPISQHPRHKKRTQGAQHSREQERPILTLISTLTESRGPDDCHHRSAFDQVAVAEKNDELIETGRGLCCPIHERHDCLIENVHLSVAEARAFAGGARMRAAA
jgi:hypothetical protein